MKSLLLMFCAVGIVVPNLTAAERQEGKNASPFVIQSVIKDRQYLFVDGGWKPEAECIKTTLRVKTDLPDTEKPFVKAYFYDKNKDLLATSVTPSSVSKDSRSTSSMPPVFERNRSYDLYFGISSQATRGKAFWHTVIVVFGAGTNAVAKAYPTGHAKDFEFPEKSLLRDNP